MELVIHYDSEAGTWDLSEIDDAQLAYLQIDAICEQSARENIPTGQVLKDLAETCPDLNHVAVRVDGGHFD